MLRLLPILLLIQCFHNKMEKNERPSGPVITMKISDRHQKYLTPVEKELYSESELPELFLKLKERSRTVCEMVWGTKKYDAAFVETLIRKENFKERPFDKWGHPLPKLIAGCWNFFKLNDGKPETDFRLVKKLYPNEKKDCYSVGFMQSYIMHNEISCDNIYTVDLDWAIQHAHFQFLRKYISNEMKDRESVKKAVGSLEIGWSARFDGKKMLASEKAEINSLCFYPAHETCYKTMENFQANFSKLKNFQLSLAELHNMKFSFSPDTVPVIFFSNALEELYTSKSEFALLYDHIQSSMQNGTKAVLIHHAAGRGEFGIYELNKSEKGAEMKTVCRDKFMSSPVGDAPAYEYSTHLDKKSTQKTSQNCSAHPLLKN